MPETIEITVKDLNFYYSGTVHVLKNINLPVYKNSVTALIGPSGCGKTTLLRCFNRMHDLYPNNRYEGEILLGQENILENPTDLISLRSRIGMVFQKPTPFPMSIFDNIAYGLKLKGIKKRADQSELVEKALQQAHLWAEVKDKLKTSAYELSGGQQQRLVIARVAGETAPLLFTSFNNSFFSLDMNHPMSSLTATIFQYAMGPYKTWHAQAWAAAFVITVFILILTILGRLIIKWRYR